MADQPAATAPAAAPAAPAAPAAAATPPPAAASPPASTTPPARAVPLSDAQKRQQARDNLAKAREAKAAKAAGAQTAAPTQAAAAAASGTDRAAPASTEPKPETAAQLAVRLRKAERELQALKQSGEATKGDLELLAALKDPSKRWDALNKVGVKYDEWTQQLLQAAGVSVEQQPDETPREKELRERLAALEGKHTEAEQAAAKAIAERDQVRRSEFARKIVTDGGEKYALTAALGKHDFLLAEHDAMVRDEAIDKPDPQEVAARVERRNEAALRAQIKALIATAKGKALITELLGVQPAAAPAAATEKPAAATVPTNGLSAERTSNGLPADWQKWTDRQKREWASARRQRASA